VRDSYAFLIGLYPPKYRALFSSEMLATFDLAAREQKQRNLPARFLFILREMAGLMKGLVSEWLMLWSVGDSYLAASAASPSVPGGMPAEVVELQGRLHRLIRHMEFAIAHHDFRNARRYSEEERATRSQLETLISRF
jgi:hypothetical protein